MKKILLSLTLMMAVLAAYSQTTVEVQIKKTGTEDGKDVSSDDAEQENDEMDKLYDDDLDAGWEGDDFNTLTTGLRFTGVEIPQGATITQAYIEVYAHEVEEDEAKILIQGEAADNSETFDLEHLISDRPLTTAKVNWNVTEKWNIWTKYKTVDISSVVQEIVARDGWKSGNALAIILQGQDQGASDKDNCRDFESFENEEDPEDGGDGKNHPDRVPKLVVVYTTGGSSVANLPMVEMAAYPNPVINGSLTIAVETSGTANLNIDVMNINGQVVYRTVGRNKQTLDLTALTPGVYVLQVRNEELFATRSISIQ